MSEKWATKETWATDLSPTALFTPGYGPVHCRRGHWVGGRVYPGWGIRVGAGRGYTGYYRDTLQDPYLTIFSLEALPTAK